ncbi:MAG: hypothetical protein GX458_07440 [Phyllobacteriaceae bacterium]|nr:hypothetical protein [Phyllobacteriaceae bacterium]
MISSRRRVPALAASLAAACCGLVASSAPTVAKDTVYRPPAAKTGEAVTPPPDLVATAERLKAAAEAGDRDAVFALIGDEIAFVRTGITVEVGRSVEKIAAGTADAALERIGLAFTEGEPVAPSGQIFDFRKSRIATALTQIAASMADPDWATDPLAPGAICTRPGAVWNAAAAKRAGFETAAVFVLAAAAARARPEPGAPVVGRLAPGRLYADLSARENEWAKLRLPDGRVGWLAPRVAKAAQPWGFCFSPNRDGGWLLSTVVEALN